jgi:hypothetical protein
MHTATSAIDLNQQVHRSDPQQFVLALRQVIGSPLPAVVFTSLATRCVPLLSDGCRIVIEEEGRCGYRIEWPLGGAAGRPPSLRGRQLTRPSRTGQILTENAVRTPFLGPTLDGEQGYRGVMLHLWNTGYRPTATDAAFAQLAVSQAVSLVHQERQTARLNQQQQRITHLQDEVRSATGDVGAAIGILMMSCRPDPR